jgi:hypothetical protein
MEKKYQIIKETVEFAYKQIEEANKTLDEMREKCDHPETEKVDYMWAPGHIMPDTEICSVCGKVTNNYWMNLVEDDND